MNPLALTAVLLLASTAAALDLPEAARVENRGARCLWASIQTAALARGDSRFDGWLADCSEWGTFLAAHEKLTRMGVRHLVDLDGAYNVATLKRYAKSHGVTVSLWKGCRWYDGRRSRHAHAILLVDFTDTHVDFYDSDAPRDAWGKPRIWRSSRAWFESAWAGNSCVVLENIP